MELTQRLALVISGIDAIGTGRLPRLLVNAGFRVHLLGSERFAAARSACVERRIACPGGPAATAAAAREFLWSGGRDRRGEYAYIVIADEPTLLAALEYPDMEWLEGWFPVPLRANSLQCLTSKTQFLVACRDAHISTPRFTVCSSQAEIRLAADAMGMPLFVKAAQGCSGSGVFFSATWEDFESQLPRMSLDHPAVAQETIQGETLSIAVLYERGRPICWLAYLMRCMWPNRFGASSAAEFFSHPDLESILTAVGATTEFHGLAGIDCMLERATGRLVVLELNPRPTPAYHLGPKVGVDFPAALRALGSAPPEQHPRPSNEIVDMFPQALYYAVQNGQPLRFFRALRDAPWGDISLTAAYFRRFLTHHIPAWIKQPARRAVARS